MKRAVPLQLIVPPDYKPALAATVLQFTTIFNAVCAYGWQRNIKNGVTLHHRLYRSLRKEHPTLASDLHIQARVKATEALKGAFTRRRHGRRTSCPQSRACPPRYNDHTFKIRWSERTVRLSTMVGRLTVPFYFPKFAERYAGHKTCTADLIERRNGTFWLYVTVDVPMQPIVPTNQVVGVDLGLSQPAVTSSNRFLGQRMWRAVDRRYFRFRRALQWCATKNAKRRLGRLRRRQHQFRRDCDHVLSKHIVSSVMPGTVIVLERLKGIRAHTRHRHGKENRWFHSWSFARLQKFIEYKAEERGCRVIAVDPRYTSQRCSRCGHQARTNRRSRALFECRACGYALHADLNGARNIAAAYRAGPGMSGASGLPVNQPDAALAVVKASSCNLSVPSDSC